MAVGRIGVTKAVGAHGSGRSAPKSQLNCLLVLLSFGGTPSVRLAGEHSCTCSGSAHSEFTRHIVFIVVKAALSRAIAARLCLGDWPLQRDELSSTVFTVVREQ